MPQPLPTPSSPWLLHWSRLPSRHYRIEVAVIVTVVVCCCRWTAHRAQGQQAQNTRSTLLSWRCSTCAASQASPMCCTYLHQLNTLCLYVLSPAAGCCCQWLATGSSAAARLLEGKHFLFALRDNTHMHVGISVCRMSISTPAQHTQSSCASKSPSCLVFHTHLFAVAVVFLQALLQCLDVTGAQLQALCLLWWLLLVSSCLE